MVTEVFKAEQPTYEQFETFKDKIAPLIGLDLTQYKSKQMERRIISFMTRMKIKTLPEFTTLLQQDKETLNKFVNMLTINVSEFFRDEKRFEELETMYLPKLAKLANGKLKIWSAGCSIGAEIYTLCMILDKMNLLSGAELYASDFDQTIIDKARNGIYTKAEYGSIKKGCEKYFTPHGTDQYKITPKFSSKIKFVRQDLLTDKFEKGFHLILCRNVVIYFTDDAKDKLYCKFYESLTPNGVLFVGSTERILNYKNIGYDLTSHFFYQKTA